MAQLTDNLLSYWKFDESSGNAADSADGNTLTNQSATFVAGGKIGNAASFDPNFFSRFTAANATVFQMGDVDFTLQMWAYISDKSSSRMIMGRWDDFTFNRAEYVVYYDLTSNTYTFTVTSVAGGVQTSVHATNFGSPALNTFALVHAWHDSVNDILGISVNGTANTISYSAGVTTGSGAVFQLGRSANQILPLWSGRMDEGAVWTRVLSSTERTILYAGGSGFSYSKILNSWTGTGGVLVGGSTTIVQKEVERGSGGNLIAGTAGAFHPVFETASGGSVVNGIAVWYYIVLNTGLGGTKVGGAAKVEVSYVYDLAFGPGDIVFNKAKATLGVLERIAIRHYRVINEQFLILGGTKMPNPQIIFYDSFNDVWNESDLVDQETAIALAITFYENQIERLNGITPE